MDFRINTNTKKRTPLHTKKANVTELYINTHVHFNIKNVKPFIDSKS